MHLLTVFLSFEINSHDVVILIAGAILGVLASKAFKGLDNLLARWKNSLSIIRLPEYNPINDNVCPLRQWNSNNKLEEGKTLIKYDARHAYKSAKPDISSCPFITHKDEWLKLYASESKKERKKKGIVSYATNISLDHNDTKKGRLLELKVSSCDYLGHQVNGLYFRRFPEDWESIKKKIVAGDLNDYFNHAMPGNIFINMIIINGATNKMLVIKRSNSELNARNVWCIGGFETMNDVSNATNGSEELTLHGITRRGLREEFTIKPNEIKELSISSISFVRHLGIMVTALVRVDLGIDSEGNKNDLTEGGLIKRIVEKADSAYEHSVLKWVPISLKGMKKYIKSEKGYYRDIICEGYSNEEKWIGYAKWEMYEIWRNHSSIGLNL